MADPPPDATPVSVTLNVPFTEVVEVGLKFTPTVHVPPGLSVFPVQVFVPAAMLNVELPPVATVLMVTGAPVAAELLFDTVTVIVVVEPLARAPKATGLGLKLIAP